MKNVEYRAWTCDLEINSLSLLPTELIPQKTEREGFEPPIALPL